MSTSAHTPLTPVDVYRRFQEAVLTGSPELLDDLYADDVVVELPFNRPGMPSRFEGRAAFLAFAAVAREAVPVRFEEFRDVVIHETADPEVVIVEYDLAGTVTTTGRSASAPFVLVLRVRDGRIVHLREYQNPLAIAAALDRLPA